MKRCFSRSRPTLPLAFGSRKAECGEFAQLMSKRKRAFGTAFCLSLSLFLISFISELVCRRARIIPLPNEGGKGFRSDGI